MSSLAVTDQPRFDREAAVLAAAGIGSGLVASMLIAIAGSHHHELMALAFGGCLGIAGAFTPGEGATPILRVIASLAGGVLLAAAVPTAVVASVLAGGAFGIGLTIEGSRLESIGAILGSAAAFGAAFFTTSSLLGAGALGLAEIPVVSELLTGGVWSTFLVASSGLRRLRWEGDALSRTLEETAREVSEPERTAVRGALGLYGPVREAIDELEDESLRENAESITGETVRALVRFAKRASELRDASTVHRGDEIESRIEEIDERIEATDNASIAEELAAARREYVQEAEARERLETAIVRLDVRQQRCLTALERLHMNLVERGRTDGAEMRLENSIAEIDELTDEMEWRNLSIEAICGPESIGDAGLETETDAGEDVVLEDVDSEPGVEEEDESERDETNDVEIHAAGSNTSS